MEETAFITSIFDHASQAHEHLSSVCANISALAKITDRVTLHTVINGAVWPLIQINIPEGFLNPVEDRQPKTTEEERWEKVQKMILPTSNTLYLAHEPRNGPTHVLAAAVWLKLNHKYFNEGDGQRGMQPVQGEGKTALQGSNREEILGWYTVEETQGHRDSNHHTRTSSPKKEGQYLKKTTYIGDIQVMVHMVKNHCKSVPAQLHHQVRSLQHLVSSIHPALAPCSSTGGTRRDL